MKNTFIENPVAVVCSGPLSENSAHCIINLDHLGHLGSILHGLLLDEKICNNKNCVKEIVVVVVTAAKVGAHGSVSFYT